MKKLSKDDVVEKDKIASELSEKRDTLIEAVDVFNAEVKAAYQKLAQFVEPYNVAIEHAKDFVDRVADEQQAYFDEKSETWQEGEKGEEYQAWIEEWGSMFLEECLISIPEDFDHPEDLSEELEGLSNSPG